MRLMLAAVLFLFSLGVFDRTFAADVREAIPGLCVTDVSLYDPLSAGIASGRLEVSPRLTLCDGSDAKLIKSDGALQTRPTGIGVVTDSGPRCDSEPTTDGQLSAVPGYAGAWLVGPTDDYRHGILGDQIEASGFCTAVTRDGWAIELTLPEGSVFEDLRVRLVDLTGDGQQEFVVVRSYLDRGAALAVYGLVQGRIEHLAETPAIGRPNRWLNPAGAADFDGDGNIEVALVETPHIGGILRVFQMTPEGLLLEQSEPGFSNHEIGSRNLDLSAVLDWNRDGIPDLALPDAERRSIRIVSFAGGRFAELERLPNDSALATGLVASDLDGDGRPELLYGLGDRSLVLARPSAIDGN